MKKEYLILIVFLTIICLSGLAIYLYMNSHTGKANTQIAMQMGDSTMSMQMPPEGMPPMGMAPEPMGGESNAPQGPDPKVLKLQIDQLESHLQHEPNDFDALVNLGNNYFDLNNPPKAIENYEKALRIQPNNPMVIVDCGSMYRQEGDPDKAIEMFNKAIQLDPNLPQAYYNLGMVTAMEKKNLPGAVTYWKKYLELDPNSEMKDFITQEIKKAEGK